MSCSPCGFSYTSSPQFLMTGQHPSVPYPAPSTAMPPESLHQGPNVVCSLPYDGRFLGSAYPRLSELYPGYSDPVAASYMSGIAGGHPAMLYPTALTSPYDLKDPRAAWAALPQAAGYPCDPAFAAAYGPYGDRFDPVDSEARRRNATRETTSTLKAWLNEHRKNPYPTKGEKIMLAIITKMTLTQVSTWFANARRRLKKENKMTWEPRNKTGDDLDDVSVDEDDDKDDDDQKSTHSEPGKKEPQSEKKEPADVAQLSNHASEKTPEDPESHPDKLSTTSLPDRLKPGDPPPTAEKPKIWSLAQTATSESPPTSRKHPLDSPHHEDFKRMRRVVYPDTLHPADLSQGSFYPRAMPRLHPDSSSESSLSSPPLWRTGDVHGLPHGDKYGRLTPLDSSDVVSVSPSSSGSPAMVSSAMDQRNSLSPSMSYSRLLGSRLFPCGEVPPPGLRPSPMDHGHFYTTQAGPVPPSLDLRTFHSAFLKASPFGYPVSFSASPSHIPPSPTSTSSASKPKPEDGNHQRSES